MTGSLGPPLEIEVVFALPERQRLVALTMEPGATVADAVAESGLADEFPDHDIAGAKLAVFGRLASRERPLRNGDRVEILRPLKADPKEVRRQLAAQGLSMGRGPSGD